MWVRAFRRFGGAEINGEIVEMLPHSATLRVDACSGMREHFVFVDDFSFIPV